MAPLKKKVKRARIKSKARPRNLKRSDYELFFHKIANDKSEII